MEKKKALQNVFVGEGNVLKNIEDPVQCRVAILAPNRSKPSKPPWRGYTKFKGYSIEETVTTSTNNREMRKTSNNHTRQGLQWCRHKRPKSTRNDSFY